MILPNVVPVMLLPSCNVFPRGLLPLFIFEPRYRAMLAHALRTDRMLCIGSLQPGPDGRIEETDESVHEYSTVALVRACVGHEDGTSHLILQGVKRVRFAGWEQHEPFRMARIEAVSGQDADPAATREVACQLLERVLGLILKNGLFSEHLAPRLKALTEPEHLADFIAAHFIDDPMKRQPLLAMTDIGERLAYLEKLLPKPAKQPFSS